MWQIAYKGKTYGEVMDRQKAEAKLMRLQYTVKGLTLVEVEE